MDRAAGDRHMWADETRAWSSQLLDRAVDDGIAFRPDRGHQDDVSRGQCRHHLVEGESSTFADTSLPDHRGEGRSDATLENLGIVAGELREILGAPGVPEEGESDERRRTGSAGEPEECQRRHHQLRSRAPQNEHGQPVDHRNGRPLLLEDTAGRRGWTIRWDPDAGSGSQRTAAWQATAWTRRGSRTHMATMPTETSFRMPITGRATDLGKLKMSGHFLARSWLPV